MKICVLIAEDDYLILESIAELLHKSQITGVRIESVFCAHNGSEGLARFRTHRPDIIITDIRMPDMDGLSMASEIKKIDPNAKVIVVTAFNDIHYLLGSISLGVSDYVLKPFDSGSFLTVVGKVINLLRLERQVRLQNDRLKKLAAELIRAEEKERRIIATRLHDTVVQNLALTLIKLQDLSSQNQSEESKAIIAGIKDMTNVSINQSRDLTYELSPPVLYELGAAAALEWLCDDMEKKGDICVHFNGRDGMEKIDEGMGIFIFRSVRELLFNVVKHAGAKNADVSINMNKSMIEVSVEDDGAGFSDANAAGRTGFGLFSIQERLDYLGGNMTIRSAPGKGSMSTLSIPIK